MQSSLYTVTIEDGKKLYFTRGHSEEQVKHMMEDYGITDMEIRETTPADVALFKENGFLHPNYSIH